MTLGAVGYAMRLHVRLANVETRLSQALSRASVADRAMVDARRAASEAQAFLAVVTAPDTIRIELSGQPDAPEARGRALWSRARGMVVTASDLPPLQGGKVYHVWILTARAPTSVGLLTPDASGAGSAVFTIAPDIGMPLAVVVTVEPEGGARLPTGPSYLTGTPAGS